MPRRPVNPQDRQRVVRACDQCKSSKKRCDGSQPCKSCERRGSRDVCHYTAGRRLHPLPRRPSTSSHQLTQRSRSNTDGSATFGSDGDLRNLRNDTTHDTSDSYAAQLRHRGLEDILNHDTRESSMDTLGQPPVMLSSTSGEKVFVGNTAAISFWRFLQKTLERHVGPSCFTDALESQKLFEADTTDTGSSYSYDGLSLEDKRAYTQHFLDASNGLLDLYSWDDVSKLLMTQDLSSRRSSIEDPTLQMSLETASLYLMVAIGAQCCGPTKDSVTWTTGLFYHARKLAMEGMLEEPSLELVRVFLLMAFYMFGACRRNSAFMYLGIASKAADILGLHVSAQYKRMSLDARNARLRTAKSIRVFDVVCNSILGRPSSTPSLRPGHISYVSDEASATSDILHRALALGATYEIAAVLDVAVTKSAEGPVRTEEAEQLVLALQQRSRNFPSILRTTSGGGTSDRRRMTIGNVHVSGAYYFSVILVTRHFLIQHVVPQLSEHPTPRPGNRGGPRLDPTEEARIAQLADACIEAADFMAQMCYQVMKSGQLLGNMCILKAWIFATGLVLGFSLLAEDVRNVSERRTSFLKSLHVLGELKRLSPQAEQYYNILSSFHQAIKAYKEQQYRNKHVARATMVDQIFQPDAAADLDEPEVVTTQLPSPEMSTHDSLSSDWLNGMSLDAIDNVSPVDQALIGENDVIMRMLWDSNQYMMDYPVDMLPEDEMNLIPPDQDQGSFVT